MSARWVVCAVVWAAVLSTSIRAQTLPRTPATTWATPVRIGVLAYRGTEDALRTWGPTADYLSEQIPTIRFQVVPLEFGRINQAAARAEVDFVITSPANYVELEAEYGATRILTLVAYRQGTELTRFAAVVFARAQRTDLNTFEDLVGRTFIATDPNSFGGWWMAWREMKQRGIDPNRDLARLEFAGTQDQVVYAVRDGRADAGTVRTDQLEQMAAEGRIDLSQFRVIQQQPTTAEFPFLRSTRLYPEWAIARLGHVPAELAKQVAVALLQMPRNSVAAQAARAAGWTIPLDYTPVHELMRELRLGPYRAYGRITLGQAVRQYWPWALGGAALLLGAFSTTAYVLRLNYRLGRLRRRLEAELAQRRRADEALLESEQRHRAVIEQASEGIILTDADSRRIIEANPAIARLLGYTLDQLVGRLIYDLIADTREGIDARIARVLESKVPLVGERPFRRRDGSVVTVESSAVVVEWSGRRVICTVVRDITERKRAEEALRQSEQRTRQIVETAHDAFVSIDASGYITGWNAQAEATFGWRRQEAIGRELAETIVPPQHRQAHRQGLKRFLAGGEGHLLNRRIEITALHRDGHEFPVELSISPLRIGDTVQFNAFIHDITHRRQAQQLLEQKNRELEQAVQSEREAIEKLKATQSALVQAEKLAALGQMVAGVAHEINNPLSFVANNVAVLQRDLAAMRKLLELYRAQDALLAAHNPAVAAEACELARRIDLDYTLSNLDDLLVRSREGLRRIQQIVGDLRDFARLDQNQLQEADLNAGIESTVNIIQGLARKRQVRIELMLGQIPPVTCYPAKINQVVMNLLSNAIDACKPGDVVTVATRTEDEQALIEVADTGCGIDPSIRARIFDPFFTTKPIGQGTGLGLSISYGIVQDHSGRIEVESEPGRGSKFVVYLPLQARK
ncbi:PAS domain S-box protein [Fontivita pretiosa]|uniref:PAS domain S-box protein n=1 Tax=Fontivita pretiosa TaxID=2989684 RepID=UPI003D16D2C0